jgi:hypothetical protein
MIKTEWNTINIGKDPLEIWQNKVRHLRRFRRGWAKNRSGRYKKERERLMLLIDELDIRAETCPLNKVESDKLRDANDKLSKIRREEESKWAQRVKVKHIKEGGNNTKYLIANGKHRKKRIYQLEQDEKTILGEENLKVFITEYYKKLFGAPTKNNFSMREDVISDIPQLSSQENNILIADLADFTEEDEVFDAISQM